MADLFDALAEVGTSLPRRWIEVLANEIERSRGPSEWAMIVTAADLGDGHPEVDRLGSVWAEHHTTVSSVIAAGLRAASATAGRSALHQQIELVWTGPGTSFIPMRRTEQVVQQVIDSAQRRLWLTSYVFVNPEGIARNLRSAIGRGVEILAILEPPSSRGGRIDHDPARNLGAIIPEAEIYEWSPAAKARANLSGTGCVHAKCIVADAATAFVTSANLTGFAMERNMEMGVLISSGAIPTRIDDHLRMLVLSGYVDRHRPKSEN